MAIVSKCIIVIMKKRRKGKRRRRRKKEEIGNETQWWPLVSSSRFISLQTLVGNLSCTGTIPGSGDTAENR